MWGGGDVGKCDSFIACSLWTLCFCAGFAAFLHFVTFIFMSENESFLLVSGFEIESLLCWFVCKWHLMTFDAFMMWKIVNSWWKTSFFFPLSPSRLSDFSLLRANSRTRCFITRLCRVPHHVKVGGPQCSQFATWPAPTDHSPTQGDGLMRAVFSRDGTSTLI